MKRSALNKHGSNRTATLVEPGLNDRALCGSNRIGLKIEHFGLQRDQLEQLVQIELLLGGNLNFERVAAKAFDLNFMLQQFRAHAFRLGVGLSILLMATINGTCAARA